MTIPAHTHPNGDPVTEAQAAVIVRVRADLLSGRYFSLVAASERGVLGYQPPINRRAYSHAMATIGQMAAESDPFTQIAHQIFGRGINAYGTKHEARAAIYDAVAKAIGAGYTDVINLASPEPGRRKDNERPYSLSECIQLAYWLSEATNQMLNSVPGVGWTVDCIRRANNVHQIARFAK